jgi:hypothetical protein
LSIILSRLSEKIFPDRRKRRDKKEGKADGRQKVPGAALIGQLPASSCFFAVTSTKFCFLPFSCGQVISYLFSVISKDYKE